MGVSSTYFSNHPKYERNKMSVITAIKIAKYTLVFYERHFTLY
jgi:hypothetical protein